MVVLSRKGTQAGTIRMRSGSTVSKTNTTAMVRATGQRGSIEWAEAGLVMSQHWLLGNNV
jgi:hypothetical protein